MERPIPDPECEFDLVEGIEIHDRYTLIFDPKCFEPVARYISDILYEEIGTQFSTKTIIENMPTRFLLIVRGGPTVENLSGEPYFEDWLSELVEGYGLDVSVADELFNIFDDFCERLFDLADERFDFERLYERFAAFEEWRRG